MSIIAGFIVPHPPLIIPTIGRGEERAIQHTIDSYHKIAKEIASIKPDVIIFSSPHGTLYRDYFHIPDDSKVSGSFAQFRDNVTSFELEHDTELIATIHNNASIQSFPMGTIGNRHQSLDHGVMVPLYFITQYYKDFKAIRVHPSGLSMTEHYQAGIMIRDTIPEQKKAVWVASGDLSHKLKKDGPYGLSKEGPVYDQQLIEILSKGAFDQLLEMDPSLCHKAAECGQGSFTMMAGAFDGFEVDQDVLSYEGPFGVGYAVAHFQRKEQQPHRLFLEALLHNKEIASTDPYVQLARQSIEYYVLHHKRMKTPKILPQELLEHRAGVFVSIHKFDRLRGCIGTTRPTTTSIADEIIENAISACSRDPRFPPINKKELQHLNISVDVLFPPEQISSLNQLDVNQYGVIVKHRHKSGLLLPNLDGIDNVKEQVSIAKKKAGITENEEVTLYRFEVVRHH